MTKQKSFKRRVRERMSKTGESYTVARTQVSQKRARIRAAGARLSDAPMPVSEAKLVVETGRDWEAWLSILDRWGAREKKHGEVATYLMEKHSVAGWYAQAITVGYERARMNRKKHQQASGGFTVYASKTVAVPSGVAFDAFINARKRRRWLTDGRMTIRTSQAGRNARFNWEDGTSRVVVFFDDKGSSKTTVSVSHEQLPDPDEAETAKAAWRRRLVDLKTYLEA